MASMNVMYQLVSDGMYAEHGRGCLGSVSSLHFTYHIGFSDLRRMKLYQV